MDKESPKTPARRNAEKLSSACKAEGCNHAAAVKGYCRKHYMRIRRHGDVEKVEKAGRPTIYGENAIDEWRNVATEKLAVGRHLWSNKEASDRSVYRWHRAWDFIFAIERKTGVDRREIFVAMHGTYTNDSSPLNVSSFEAVAGLWCNWAYGSEEDQAYLKKQLDHHLACKADEKHRRDEQKRENEVTRKEHVLALKKWDKLTPLQQAQSTVEGLSKIVAEEELRPEGSANRDARLARYRLQLEQAKIERDWLLGKPMRRRMENRFKPPLEPSPEEQMLMALGLSSKRRASP